MHIEIENTTEASTRAYDFKQGDVRASDFNRAIEIAIERSKTRGRQTVRDTVLGPHLDGWLVQDIEAPKVTETIKAGPQVVTDYNHHGTGPRRPLAPTINVLIEEPRRPQTNAQRLADANRTRRRALDF